MEGIKKRWKIIADETFVGKNIAVVDRGGTGKGQEWKVTNGTDIKAGLIVANDGETADSHDWDLATATDKNLAHALRAKIEDQSLDVALGDNEDFLIQLPGYGNKGWGVYQANGASIKKGQRLIVGSEGGKLAPFSYVDAAELTDTVVGAPFFADQDVTTDASNDQIIKIRS